MYPWGLQISGSGLRLDYRLALVSLPWTHEDYTPDPGFAVRPAVGVGVTPRTGLRLGASFTTGPYLSSDLRPDLPVGADWKDYTQRVFAFDARFSRGYFEGHAELALSRYEVPTRGGSLEGSTYYGEIKYTWTPRFFTALRLERNRRVDIAPVSAGAWPAGTVAVSDGEIGVGYRIGVRTLLKVSYRRDHRQGPAGSAAALQLSQGFDLKSLLQARQ